MQPLTVAREDPPKMIAHVFQLAWWSLVDGMRVSQWLHKGGSSLHLRLAWCLIGASAGVSLAYLVLEANSVVGVVAFALLGALLFTIAGVDLRFEGSDSLGLMILSLLVMLAGMSSLMSTRPAPATPEYPWWTALIAFGLIAATGYAGFKLAQAGNSRAFLFWPTGLACFVALSSRSESPISNMLGRVYPTPRWYAVPVLLVLVLLVFSVASAQACARSFRNQFTVEEGAAYTMATFKRRLAVVYALFAAACQVLPGDAFVRVAGWIFAGAALFELALPQWAILSVALSRGNWIARRRGRLPWRTFGAHPLLIMPSASVPPLGIARHFSLLLAQVGRDAAADLMVEVLLRTAYYEPARRAVERMAAIDPLAFDAVRWRYASRVPTELLPPNVASVQETSPATVGVPRPRTRVPAPAMVAAEPAGAGDDTFYDTAYFRHRYQAPRGKEGAPLAALPIWFPVAASPQEVMTVPQIVYRSLASVREPFRRTQLLLADAETSAKTYREVVRHSLQWVGAGDGASVFPVALSLAKLAQNASRLSELAEELKAARKASKVRSGKAGLNPMLMTGCKDLVESGWALPAEPDPATLRDAVDAVIAGNAYLLVEDDGRSLSHTKTVRRAFDEVFGEHGLSHVAIIMVSHVPGRAVVSDFQAFHLEPEGEQTSDPARRPPRPTGWVTTAACRVLAGCGTPSAATTLTAVGFVTAALLALMVWKYDDTLGLVASMPKGLWNFGTSMAGVLSAFIIGAIVSSFVIGYVWGLAYGSEEVRISCVVVMTTVMFGAMLLLLGQLPRAMPNGWVKTTVTALALLPAAALLAVGVIGTISMIANTVWLIVSERIIKHLDVNALRALTRGRRVVLHVAVHGVRLTLPVSAAKTATKAAVEARELPILLSMRGRRLISVALEAFPELAEGCSVLIVEGLQRGSATRFASSSLMLAGLCPGQTPSATRCLSLVKDECLLAWGGDMDQFADYYQPSTSFTMNALEYACRYLCYETNLEELVVVR